MNNLRGAKIIYQESKATQPSHLYFLQKDANYYDIIVTSESGAKRKFSLSNYYTKNETYSQNEIDDFLDLKADFSSLGNYYTKLETYSQTEIDNSLALKLDKGAYTGTAQDLKTEIDDKLEKGTYTGTAQDIKDEIDSKQNLLSSFDESILIEPDGNIEGNVSLFTEYFNQQVCELNFTPIQIIGIYVNGIKQRPSSYVITLPKTITIVNFTSGDYIEIQYTKLKI